MSTAHWQGTGRGRRSRSRVSILQAQLGRTRIHMLQTRCIVPWLSTVAAPVVDVGCAHCMDLHEASRLDDDTTCRPVANSLECDRTLNRPSSTVVPCRLDWSFGRSLQHHRRLAEVQEYQVSPSFLFTSPESRILSFRSEAPSCRPGAHRSTYRTPERAEPEQRTSELLRRPSTEARHRRRLLDGDTSSLIDRDGAISLTGRRMTRGRHRWPFSTVALLFPTNVFSATCYYRRASTDGVVASHTYAAATLHPCFPLPPPPPHLLRAAASTPSPPLRPLPLESQTMTGAFAGCLLLPLSP